MLFGQRVDPVRFVILFQGRAGSTMLRERLESHSNVHVFGEVFDAFPQTWSNQRTWMHKYLVKMKGAHREHTAIGFKTKLSSVADEEAFRSFLETQRIRIIHLERTNPIKLAVSVIRAKRLRERTGASNTSNSSDRPGRIHITPNELAKGLRRVKRYEELAEYVEKIAVQRLRISYEQLLEEPTQTLANIFDFLEVDVQPTKASLVKLTSDNLEEDVSNVDELRNAFPEYGRFF